MRCIFPPHSPLPPASPFLPSLPLVLCVPGSFSFPRSRFQGRFPQRPRLTIVSKIAPPPNYPLSRHLGSRLVIFTAHNYLLFTVCLFMASLPQRGASRTKAGIRHRRALIFALLAKQMLRLGFKCQRFSWEAKEVQQGTGVRPRREGGRERAVQASYHRPGESGATGVYFSQFWRPEV